MLFKSLNSRLGTALQPCFVVYPVNRWWYNYMTNNNKGIAMKTTPLLLASLAIFAANLVSAASISGQGTWETTLQARDLDGNSSTAEAYYDTVLNITWLADANYAGINMPWSSAINWAAYLNINGYTGWRLPKTNPIDGTTADDDHVSYIGSEDRGFNVSAPGTLYAGSTASEMAHLFYNTLGNLGYCDPAASSIQNCSGPQTGWGLSNTGPFSNIQDRNYWSGTEAHIWQATYEITAWTFNFETGDQFVASTNSYDILRAWAVHDGDVGFTIPSSVPLPAAAWLFGSGLFGLIVVSGKKKQYLPRP